VLFDGFGGSFGPVAAEGRSERALAVTLAGYFFAVEADVSHVCSVRTLLRYLMVCGLAVGLAWGLFVVRVGDRTVFGHVRHALDKPVGDVWAQLKSGTDTRLDELNGATADERKKKQTSRARAKALADKKASARPALATRAPAPAKPKVKEKEEKKAPAIEPIAMVEKKKNDAQVSKLKEAETLARSMQRADTAAPPKKTKVDEQISPSGKSRVDQLLAQ